MINAFDIEVVLNEPNVTTTEHPMFRPTVQVPAITLNDSGRRVLDNYHWGFEWFDGKGFKNTFNTRMETTSRLKTFRQSFESRRCLMPANGFYEWKTILGQKKKERYLFTTSDNSPFCFAGIWRPQRLQKYDGITMCASMLTGAPTQIMDGIHDRMPCILSADTYSDWLDPKADTNDLLAMLKPFPAEMMTRTAPDKQDSEQTQLF